MYSRLFHYLAKRSRAIFASVTLLTFLVSSSIPALAMNASLGGSLPQPLPLFPADNWWNLDISNWPVDGNSANFINFINNGGSRRLHPDFGGNSGSGFGIYGMPYAVVTNVTEADKKAVQFDYWEESDGVNLSTGVSFPFYPIPPEAITEPYWIEGGNPGNVDERCCADRHLLIVDRDRNHLYELYNVYYNTSQGTWYAGSGAFFDMNTNHRRPEGWTSADAAGLAILPGLVRYDEVNDPTVTEIKHAFRVTARATNGYVYPASHRAGSTSGALPMGARLRLKASVDVTQRTNDPNIQKIFRAMQKYGLIVADNGSDMFISGTYDPRWNNDILNPAFKNLTASDFEVIQLGYNPTVQSPALSSVGVSPSSVTGGQSATGTVTVSSPAPVGGLAVSLSSANSAASVPPSAIVAAGATEANFSVTTSSVSSTTIGNIIGTYNGTAKSTTFTVNPAPPVAAALATLSLSPTRLRGGNSALGTVTLTAPAPSGGYQVNLSSSNTVLASAPATITVAGGGQSATFTVTTATVRKNTRVEITASAGGISKIANLTIRKR